MTLFGKAVATILILGGGFLGYFLYSFSGTPSSEMPLTNATTTDVSASKKIPFAELIKQGGSYRCEVKQYYQNTETVGTVYTGKGNVYAEYSMKVMGQVFDTNFILVGDTTYTWTSMTPGSGFKTKTATGAVASTSQQGDTTTYSWNAEQIGDYTCSDWVYDEAQFTPPKGITFKSL